MSTFCVEPEALRVAAAQLRGARQAEPPPRWPTLPDFGEPSLHEAARTFARRIMSAWATWTDELDEVADRMLASADAYERADLDGIAR